MSELFGSCSQKGILVDAFCCCNLVEHFCTKGLVESVTGLHDEIKKLGGCLDVTSYSALLLALFRKTEG